MNNKQSFYYSLESNWLGLFKKVYKKVDHFIEYILNECLHNNSYICTEYILNNHKIDWNRYTNWLYYPSSHNNKELALLLIKHGCNIDSEIEYCEKYNNKERLKFCLEIKKEIKSGIL